jgi:FKBP-type peptidyl-prolyl cis-trans isomerase SlyD
VKIARDRVVCIDYTIRLPTGAVIESSLGNEPLTYLHGRRQIVPGVERAIEGLHAGSALEVIVPPAEAYGERDPTGVFLIPRAAFPPEEVTPGALYSAARPGGSVLTFRVLEASDEFVLVDANHPLAGETLHVSVRVRGVRSATEEEIALGKATEAVVRQPEYLA